MQAKYRKFSEKQNLAYQPKRATVEGYRRISVKDLQNLENRDILKKKIANGEISLKINPEKQNRHVLGTKEYKNGRSYITISIDEAESIVESKYATGKVTVSKSGQIKETLFENKIIGMDLDFDGSEHETNGFKIHYSKTGTHIVPYRKRDEE